MGGEGGSCGGGGEAGGQYWQQLSPAVPFIPIKVGPAKEGKLAQLSPLLLCQWSTQGLAAQSRGGDVRVEDAALAADSRREVRSVEDWVLLGVEDRVRDIRNGLLSLERRTEGATIEKRRKSLLGVTTEGGENTSASRHTTIFY